jgi:hypothetical protein
MRYLVAFIVLGLPLSCSRSKNVTLAKDLDAKTLSDRMCEKLNRDHAVIPVGTLQFLSENDFALWGQPNSTRVNPSWLEIYRKLSEMGIISMTQKFTVYQVHPTAKASKYECADNKRTTLCFPAARSYVDRVVDDSKAEVAGDKYWWIRTITKFEKGGDPASRLLYRADTTPAWKSSNVYQLDPFTKEWKRVEQYNEFYAIDTTVTHWKASELFALARH